MSEARAIEGFADFVLDASVESLPATARSAAEVFLLDTVGVGIAGSTVDQAHWVRRAALQWGRGDEARVLGAGLPLPASSAAYVNSFQIHCQEFDCLHEAATVHAMAVVCGALLAVGEKRGYSGDQLLLGVALGVDVAANLGLAATSELRFFRPATAGALGATAALARLANLDRKAFLDAWGLAYSQLAGTMQAHVEGSVALPLQIANAARAAVNSMELVDEGLSGPHDILEGPFGYFSLFEDGGNLDRIVGTLGHPWRITELSHKPFPTGRAAHGTLDGLLRLQEEHRFALQDVAEVRAYVPPLVHRLVGRPISNTMSRNYARLCLQYLAPTLLRQGSIDTTSFLDAESPDAEIVASGKCVRIIMDDNADPNAMRPQRIEVDLRDGTRLRRRIEHTLGSPQRPFERKRQLEKFHHCVQVGAIPTAQAKRLEQALDELSSLPHVSDLMDLAVAPQD